MIGEILIYIASFIGMFAIFFFFLSYRERAKLEKPEFDEKRDIKKVTVIIPAYNEERGIESTIESALALDYPRRYMEIIVVDDGSKDNTYKLAKKYESNIVKVYTKKNGGKGTALNFGIKKAKGEIIFSMDADSMVTPNAIKEMIVYFRNPKVMCVSPLLAVYQPKGILQRIQQVEYFVGIFLREVFTSLNAANVTPGAFSGYRKYFFDKYGGYDEHNLTEDLEIALRIQYNNFIIENSTAAVVYTDSPDTFMKLAIQRRRWYVGLLQNLRNYYGLFSRNYGALGTVVLPLALTSILVALVLSGYVLVKYVSDLKNQIHMLGAINFNIISILDFSSNNFQRTLFSLLSNPLTLMTVIFLSVSLFYMFFAKKRVKKHSSIFLGFPLFIFFYSFLYSFWWIISIVYSLFNKKVSWR